MKDFFKFLFGIAFIFVCFIVLPNLVRPNLPLPYGENDIIISGAIFVVGGVVFFLAVMALITFFAPLFMKRERNSTKG